MVQIISQLQKKVNTDNESITLQSSVVLVYRLSVEEQPKLTPIASGVDVMITIFGDFRQFSAKNGAAIKKQYFNSKFSRTALF
jgi:hypothetical protein